MDKVVRLGVSLEGENAGDALTSGIGSNPVHPTILVFVA